MNEDLKLELIKILELNRNIKIEKFINQKTMECIYKLTIPEYYLSRINDK